MHPLVTEAMKKAAIAWLDVGAGPPYAVWCLWIDDALYVVSGSRRAARARPGRGQRTRSPSRPAATTAGAS